MIPPTTSEEFLLSTTIPLLSLIVSYLGIFTIFAETTGMREYACSVTPVHQYPTWKHPDYCYATGRKVMRMTYTAMPAIQKQAPGLVGRLIHL